MYCPAHHPSAASNITTRTAGEELPLVAAAPRTTDTSVEEAAPTTTTAGDLPLVPATPTTTKTTHQFKPAPIHCIWSFRHGILCDPILPPPEMCSIRGCNLPVHHVCVIKWENSQGYEGTPRTVCPDHHDYYQLVRRSGAAPAAAAAAAASRAATVRTGLIAHPPNVFPFLSPDTGYNKQPPPLPPLPPPPMDIMINNTSTANASPAESTLTGNPPAAPNYPCYMVLGSAESNDENVDDNDDAKRMGIVIMMVMN